MKTTTPLLNTAVPSTVLLLGTQLKDFVKHTKANNSMLTITLTYVNVANITTTNIVPSSVF